MTEEEAKTKSCCGPMQAEFGKTHVVNCIGSACMAWRWANPKKYGGGPVQETVTRNSARLPARPGHEWIAGTKANDKEYHYGLFPLMGFCGLAGKP